MCKKDLCPRQALGFQHTECRSTDFILPGSIFILRCCINPGSAHKVLKGIFVWRHWHVVGTNTQAGGRVGMDQDPFSWHCHREKDEDVSSLIPSAPWTPLPKPMPSKTALPCLQPVVSHNRLARQWGVSQGFCNRFNQMTVWKEVQKAARMGASNHSKSSGQWSCTLLFAFVRFTASLQLCRSSFCIRPLQGQVLPSGLCLPGNQNEKQ